MLLLMINQSLERRKRRWLTAHYQCTDI